MVHFFLFGMLLGSACGTVVAVFELAIRRGATPTLLNELQLLVVFRDCPLFCGEKNGI
jgi:hypothetical protein